MNRASQKIFLEVLYLDSLDHEPTDEDYKEAAEVAKSILKDQEAKEKYHITDREPK